MTAEGGTFGLRFPYPYASAYEEAPGGETPPLPYNATASEVETALEALPSIGGLGGAVKVTGGPGNATGSSPYEITFEGKLSGDEPPLINVQQTEENSAALEQTPALTGSTHKITTKTLVEGGGPEICRPLDGDACKAGGDFGSGANGTFSQWQTPETSALNLVAVDPTTQDIYVGDTDRIQRFTPEGVYWARSVFPAPELPKLLSSIVRVTFM